MAALRPAECDLLLMVLAAAAGAADAWSYFGLNHSFVANMTGNTVLIGVALAHRNGDLRHPLISLIGYAFGVMAGSLLTRKVRPENLWPRAVSWTLLLESLLLALAEAGWAIVHEAASWMEVDRNLLLVGVAFAIGLQSGALLQMKIPGVVTTYITGTWTNLMSGLARLVARGDKPLKGGKKQFEERLLLQAGILSAYLLSAAAAGLILRYFPAGAGVLPASAVLFVSAYGLVRT